jgi:YHS domain-containing protein
MKITTTFGSLLCCSAIALAACGNANKAETAPPATPATPAASEHGDDHHAKKSTSSGAVKAPGDANVGDTTKCPVSGEEFDVTATSPKAEHEGKTYYFCCGGCKKKFEANPAGVLHKT